MRNFVESYNCPLGKPLKVLFLRGSPIRGGRPVCGYPLKKKKLLLMLKVILTTKPGGGGGAKGLCGLSTKQRTFYAASLNRAMDHEWCISRIKSLQISHGIYSWDVARAVASSILWYYGSRRIQGGGPRYSPTQFPFFVWFLINLFHLHLAQLFGNFF